MSAAPRYGVVSVPSLTVHLALALGSLGVHPLRSLPLNSFMGSPHFGSPVLFRLGARTPVHCQGLPSGPVVVPANWSPTNLPLKIRSSFRSSSSLGETNVIWSPDISIFGSGRALPDRLTNWALN